MAKEKVNPIKRDRDLGTVTSKEASGFFMTSKEEKVPALHGLKIGDKVKLVNGDYEVNGGKGDEPEKKEATGLADVNEKFKAIEAELEAVKSEQVETSKELEKVKSDLGKLLTPDPEKVEGA